MSIWAARMFYSMSLHWWKMNIQQVHLVRSAAVCCRKMYWEVVITTVRFHKTSGKVWIMGQFYVFTTCRFNKTSCFPATFCKTKIETTCYSCDEIFPGSFYDNISWKWALKWMYVTKTNVVNWIHTTQKKFRVKNICAYKYKLTS